MEYNRRTKQEIVGIQHPFKNANEVVITTTPGSWLVSDRWWREGVPAPSPAVVP